MTFWPFTHEHPHPQRPAVGCRVVVTGIGAVSPNGIGREAFWTVTREGQSGVNKLEGFDAGDLATRIQGRCSTSSGRWLSHAT